MAKYTKPTQTRPMMNSGNSTTAARSFAIPHAALIPQKNIFHAIQISAITNMMVSIRSPLSRNSDVAPRYLQLQHVEYAVPVRIRIGHRQFRGTDSAKACLFIKSMGRMHNRGRIQNNITNALFNRILQSPAFSRTLRSVPGVLLVILYNIRFPH